MKNLNKSKNTNFEDILAEFKYSESIPSKNFENKLKNQFLSASSKKQSFISKIKLKKSFWLFNFFVFSLLSTLALFGYNQINNRTVMAKTFENIYQKSPQSALMPVFANLNKYTEVQLEEAMNISTIPRNKDFYGTSTTTQITHGVAHSRCVDIFKFDKSISKTTTFEIYKNNIYKFKTHVFNQDGIEVDILLFSDGEYISQKQDKTLEILASNSKDFEEYLPNNIYKTDTNNLLWDETTTCDGKKQTVQNTIIFNPQNEIESFEVSIKNTSELIYKANFEIQPMSELELIEIDAMFDIGD